MVENAKEVRFKVAIKGCHKFSLCCVLSLGASVNSCNVFICSRVFLARTVLLVDICDIDSDCFRGSVIFVACLQ